MLTQAESPAWLVRAKREDDARRVLKRVRSKDHDVDGEIAEIRSVASSEGSYRDLLEPAIRRALIVGIALAVFQQITGINTVIYYAPTLLHDAGFGNSAALLANVGNGIVNVGMTIVAIWLIDRVGRRVLLLTGTSGMVVGLTTIALVFLIGGDHLSTPGAVIAILALAIYTGSFAIGLGPVFWLLISEFYPLRIRGKAMSVATIANWSANFVVTISFLTLLNAISNAGTFFLFAFLSLVALWYFNRNIPETKNLSLQEIEVQLAK
jgi:sugar porter (SP) family MFS transporter